MYSCPDLTYSMRILSRFCSNSGPVHVELIKYVLQYTSVTLELELIYDGKTDIPDNIIGYTNSNFVESKIDWKSIRDYVFILAGVVISHLSKL